MKNIRKNFLQLFIPITIAVSCKRIINQIDIIMISYISSYGLAIMGLTQNILFIDYVIAISLSPVMVSAFSHAKDNLCLKKTFNFYILFIFILSFSVSIISFFISLIAQLFFKLNMEINNVFQLAILISIFGIISEFYRFMLNLIFQILGKRRMSIKICVLEIALNFVLNYFLAYTLKLGVIGIYLSTLFSSLITVTFFFLKIPTLISFKYLYVRLCSFKTLILDSYNLFKQIVPEAMRISGQKVLFLFLIFLISAEDNSVLYMSVFSVFQSTYFLLLVPFVAVLRSLIILLNQYQNDSALENELAKFIRVMILSSMVVVIFTLGVTLSYARTIAAVVYNLSSYEQQHWFNALIISLIFLLPAELFHVVQRSILYKENKQVFLAKIEATIMWVTILPFFYIGLKMNNPYIAWFGLCANTYFSVIALTIFYPKTCYWLVNKTEVLIPKSS